MKYHIAFKFLAIVLCAAFLLLSVGFALGIFAVAEVGLYENTVEDLQIRQMESNFYGLAGSVARRYAAATLGNCTEEFIELYTNDHYADILDLEEGTWFYMLRDESGTVLESTYDETTAKDAMVYEQVIAPAYPVVLKHEQFDIVTGDWVQEPTEAGGATGVTIPETVPDEAASDETVPSETDPVTTEEAEYLHTEDWGFETDGIYHHYELGIYRSPLYQVTLYVMSGAYTAEEHWTWELAQLGYTHRYNLIWALGASLLLTAVSFVYLCCAAGRKPKSQEVRPGGLNRVPLDLYGAALGTAVVAGTVICFDVIRWNFDWNFEMAESWWLVVLLAAAVAYVACLLVVAFLYSCAAQFKMPGFYWLRHSVVGMTTVGCFRLLKYLIGQVDRFGKWLEKKLPVALKKLWAAVKWIWNTLVKIIAAVWKTLGNILASVFAFLGKTLRAMWRSFRQFALLLPLTWQWLLTAFGMILLLYIAFNSYSGAWLVVCMFLYLGIVLYGAHCFGTLLESTKRMSQGDLDTKVEEKLLLGSFQEYATHLNALADVAVEAARKQMKSERMKAELVTNVSHDIKTPLTSIINYVDLLQKAESEEQAEEYLEVLSRQSQRLKKLIEDQMEMSKASTGNMHVELTSVDPVEAINQALGEFSEKLEKANLTPVFNPPQEAVRMNADGRLTWRVLSNLLGNAVKYALPGTRLYIDLVELDGKVLISLKNISAEQLNVSSEELLERFVRGDASRNTEGSGLGLNIARSLMDLQKGQLQLLVDGDLFKVTLIFPSCS